MDRFAAVGRHGLLLLHGAGNVFVRQLEAGQSLLVKPTALVYKDPQVSMSLQIEHPRGLNNWWRRRFVSLRLRGPGGDPVGRPALGGDRRAPKHLCLLPSPP